MTVQTRSDANDIDHSFEEESSRGGRGQFRKGRSGNPNGRPRKAKMPAPDSLSAALVQVLGEMVSVTSGGKKREVPRYRALAMKMVAEVFNAPLALQIKAFAFWERYGLIQSAKDAQRYVDDLREMNAAPGWTPELEARYRLLEGTYDEPYEELLCSRCGKCDDPDPGDVTDNRAGGDDLGRWDG